MQRFNTYVPEYEDEFSDREYYTHSHEDAAEMRAERLFCDDPFHALEIHVRRVVDDEVRKFNVEAYMTVDFRVKVLK